MLFVRALHTSTGFFGAVTNRTLSNKRFLKPIQPLRSYQTTLPKMAGPKYLTGDKAGIDAFIDQFDVSR